MPATSHWFDRVARNAACSSGARAASHSPARSRAQPSARRETGLPIENVSPSSSDARSAAPSIRPTSPHGKQARVKAVAASNGRPQGIARSKRAVSADSSAASDSSRRLSALSAQALTMASRASRSSLVEGSSSSWRRIAAASSCSREGRQPSSTNVIALSSALAGNGVTHGLVPVALRPEPLGRSPVHGTGELGVGSGAVGSGARPRTTRGSDTTPGGRRAVSGRGWRARVRPTPRRSLASRWPRRRGAHTSCRGPTSPAGTGVGPHRACRERPRSSSRRCAGWRRQSVRRSRRDLPLERATSPPGERRPASLRCARAARPGSRSARPRCKISLRNVADSSSVKLRSTARSSSSSSRARSLPIGIGGSERVERAIVKLLGARSRKKLSESWQMRFVISW